MINILEQILISILVFQMLKQELRAMERLDILENNLVLEESSIGEVNKFVDLSQLETKVYGSLRKNVFFMFLFKFQHC